jgi:hypothetical protein
MKRKGVIYLALALALGALALAGCQSAPPAKTNPTATAPEYFACVPDAKLTKHIAPQAELVDFRCYFDKYKNIHSLHFLVTVRNVSDVEQRYRVNIFLDNGKAVGGLIPRKTKKGLVKPGATASYKYPVKGMDSKPGAVELVVKAMKKK